MRTSSGLGHEKMRRHRCRNFLCVATISFALFGAETANAQAMANARECTLGRIAVSFDPGAPMSGDTAARTGEPLTRPRSLTSIDTTFQLNIPLREWNRANVSASLSAGAGSTGARPWHVCLGAAIHLAQVNLTMRNVQGQVHYRARLDDILRAVNAPGR
jgi:hypothetical protein